MSSFGFVVTISSGLGTDLVVVIVVVVVDCTVVLVVIGVSVDSDIAVIVVLCVIVVDGAGVVVDVVSSGVVVVGSEVVVGARQGSPSPMHSGDFLSSQQTGAVFGHTVVPHIVVVKLHSASLVVQYTWFPAPQQKEASPLQNDE